MTNQELLSGFLDRSLNEDQLLEFEARQSASPEFTSEVREMLAIEELLTTSAPRVSYPVGFLATVESSIALKIVAGVAATGFVAGIAHSVWGWIAGGTAAVVIGGGTLYLATNHDQPATESTKTSTPAIGSTAPTHTPAYTPTRQPVSIAVASTRRQTVGSTARLRDSDPLVLKAKTNDPMSVTKQLMVDYEQCKGSNNHVRCAQLALNIGRQLRKEDQGTEARQYFEAAIQHARAMKLIDFEIDATGELGLLAVSEGDEQRATVAFTRAVDLGEGHQKNVDVWSSELNKLLKR